MTPANAQYREAEPEADWSDDELVCEALADALASDDLRVRGERHGYNFMTHAVVKWPALSGGTELMRALRDSDAEAFMAILRPHVEAALIEAQEKARG